MAAYIIDFFARRRVAREEAEMLKRYYENRPSNRSGSNSSSSNSGSSNSSTDPLTDSKQPLRDGQETRYDSLPYTPSCCAVQGETAHAYPITILRNIAYWTEPGSSKRHSLDIYYSPEAIAHHRASRVDAGKAGVPITIHVHGGGWQRGDRTNEWRGGPNAGRSIARHGMIGVVPNYRLAPIAYIPVIIWFFLLTLILTSIISTFSSFVREDFLVRWMQLYVLLLVTVLIWRGIDESKKQHPEAALDVCRVVKWVRKHIQEHVGKEQHVDADTSRVFLSGHSAGGHLVSLISTDSKYYKQVGLHDTSFIKGVCSVSGLYTLIGPLHRDPSTWKNRIFRFSYGAAAFGTSTEKLIDASPITHVSASSPPFLIMSAASDMGLETDAEVFCERLKELGVPHEFHSIPNTSHASIASGFEKHQAHAHLFRFIDKCCTTGSSSQSHPSSSATTSSSSSSQSSAKDNISSEGTDPCWESEADYVHVSAQTKKSSSKKKNGSRSGSRK